MSEAGELATTASCRDAVAELFRAGTDFRIGLEFELLTRVDGGARPSLDQLRATLAGLSLPAQGRISFEPGGAVEVSTPPCPAVDQACDALLRDLAVVSDALTQAGIGTSVDAIDLRRDPHRVVDHPRYRYMEAQLDSYSPAGRWMMSNTASLQVNVNNCVDNPLHLWNTLWWVSPILTAMFANSPGLDSLGRRWSSLRQGCWLALDPARTGPVRPERGVDGYTDFALGAPVLVIPGTGIGEDGSSEPAGWRRAPSRMSFADWIANSRLVGRAPTVDDFAYHLTTLFPDIRPRRWLEIRCIDAVDLRHVDAVATMVAGVGKASSVTRMSDVVPHVSPVRGAMTGVRDPEIAAACSRLAGLAIEAAADVPGAHPERLASFVQRYTHRRRSPGSDRVPMQRSAPDLGRAPMAGMVCGDL